MGIEFNWRSGGAPIAHSDAEPPWRSRRIRRRLLAVVLAVAVVAGAVHWRAQRGLAAARADIERVVIGEVLALQTGRSDLFLAALDDAHTPWIRYHEESFRREAAWYADRPEARPRVERIRLGADEAQALIVLAAGQCEWRGTWFFRRAGGQWLHAPPPSEYWGELDDFSTAHVTLMAQGPDCAAAADLVTELEEFYVSLTAAYPPASAAYAGVRDEDMRARSRPPSRVTIRSYPYGASITGADYFASPQLALELWSAQERAIALRRSARLAVARAVLQRASGRSRPAAGDGWLVEALALWHAGAWEAGWRPDVQQSLAGDAFKGLLDLQGYDGAAPATAPGAAALDPAWLQPLAYTLGEYLGLTYPAEQLEALIGAMAPGSPGDALATALGVSRAVLEAGWGAYLRERYG